MPLKSDLNSNIYKNEVFQQNLSRKSHSPKDKLMLRDIFLSKNISYGRKLDLLQQGDSNLFPQNMM